MKKFTFAFLFLSIIISNKIFAQDPPQLKEGFIMPKNFKNPYDEESRGWKSRSSNITTFHTYDALHYNLNLDLYKNYTSPYAHDYKAIETFTFKADSIINFIKINATNASITIDSVKLAGTSFTQKNDTLTVNLDKTYNIGDTATIKIYYTHNNYTDKSFYAANGFVYTDCSPEKARNWFPCWDKSFDKATFEITTKTKKGTPSCSNGALQDSLTIGDTTTYHWKSKFPIATYIMADISNTKFLEKRIYWKRPSNPKDSIPVIFYYNSGEKVDTLKDVMLDMMTYFSSVFGEYPFEKIAWATLDGNFPWAGMENQTLISLYTNGWTDRNTTSHEFTHHWFGDLITGSTWADVILKEGFAQLGVCLWFEHLQGHKGWVSKGQEFANYYLQNNPGRTLYNSSWATTTPATNILFDYSMTYCKSACVLYMLRGILGDSTFLKFIKSYATDPAFMFKNVSVQDFYNKLKTYTGQDYSWFLDEWLNNPNHPIYSNTYDISHPNTNWKVDYTISQTQTNAPVFNMPIELSVTFKDKTDTIIKVMNNQITQLFSFSFKKEPISVVFDPNVKILPKVEYSSLTCLGSTTLTASSDTIEDGSGKNNYGNNYNCNWFINPTNNFSTIKIHFLNFDTEQDNDVLSIYNNSTNPIQLIGSYSGKTIPADLFCNTKNVRIKFTTNSSVSNQGWTLVYTTTTGIEENSGIENIKVFPNPATDIINLNYELTTPSKSTISIKNILGQNIYKENIEVSTNIEKQINTSNINKGIYFIEVDTEKGSFRKKIIIE